MFVVGTFENKAVGSKNLFQLRASAVLSWLKFSSTLARLGTTWFQTSILTHSNNK